MNLINTPSERNHTVDLHLVPKLSLQQDRCLGARNQKGEKNGEKPSQNLQQHAAALLNDAVVQWLPLFSNPEAAQIILDSSQFLIAVIAMILRQPKFGKILRALANDSELARLSRINSDRYALFAFAAGSFLAAVAAIINSFDTEQIAFHIQKYIFVYKSIQ